MAPPQGSVSWRQRRTCLRSTLRAWAKALQVRPLASLLDFTHFKRHKRGNLQVDSTERPGVPAYPGQLQTWKTFRRQPQAAPRQSDGIHCYF